MLTDPGTREVLKEHIRLGHVPQRLHVAVSGCFHGPASEFSGFEVGPGLRACLDVQAVDHQLEAAHV